MGAMFSAIPYFILKRQVPFWRLVAMFVVSQLVLTMLIPSSGNPGDDWPQAIVGPVLLAYLAGRFWLTRPPQP
jgi:hypothetical protein